jgi:hypothetical protein
MINAPTLKQIRIIIAAVRLVQRNRFSHGMMQRLRLAQVQPGDTSGPRNPGQEIRVNTPRSIVFYMSPQINVAMRARAIFTLA